MILINNGSNPFRHNGFTLYKGVKTEVPEDVAKELLKIKGVEKYIAPKDLEAAAKAAEAKAARELAEAKAEIEKLKSQLADNKPKAAEAKAKKNK